MLHSVRGVSADRVLVVGCGKSPVTAGSYRRILRAALDTANSAGARNVTSYLSEVMVLDRDAAWAIRQAVESGHETVYRFDRCKGEAATVTPPDLRKLTVAVDADALAAASAAVRTGDGIGTGVRLAKDLGNLPGNVCTPSYLAEQAKRLAARHASLKATVYDEKQMASMKMGSLLSVAQGSTEPPRLIVLEHKGGEASAPPTVLVGKGVTFDSGGISIKPSAAMDEMKFDMCGAASVLGTLAATAELELPLNVVGIIPATENLPGNNATKPGDIFTSMSGQTIEVLNTDAEGRLILCDALTFASRFKPDTVIDIATLTGACVIALGAHASGLFDNDDDLAGALLAAGESSGDRAWRMPVWEEYGEALKSNFADVANVGGREAGAITAAAFLARFAKNIAGPIWTSREPPGAAVGARVRPAGRCLCSRSSCSTKFLRSPRHPSAGYPSWRRSTSTSCPRRKRSIGGRRFAGSPTRRGGLAIGCSSTPSPMRKRASWTSCYGRSGKTRSSRTRSRRSPMTTPTESSSAPAPSRLVRWTY